MQHFTYHIGSNNSSTVSSAAENLSLEHLRSITGEREDLFNISMYQKLLI